MSTTLRIYQVARDGKIIGAYTIDELVVHIDAGAVQLSDVYLTEGMSDWRKVNGLSVAIEEARANQADQERKFAGREAFEQSMKAKRTSTWMHNLLPPDSTDQAGRPTAGVGDLPRAGHHDYPQPSGLKRGVLYILISGPLAILCTLILLAIVSSAPHPLAGAVAAFILGSIAWLGIALLVLHGFANINAYSIEMALQRFDQYRRR